MTVSPLDPLRPLFGEQLQELAGAVASGEIPLTSSVVNRLIAQKLAGANAPIVSAEIATTGSGAFIVHLRPKGPIPLLKVDVTIDRQPQLPADPRLGLRWTVRGVGPLALLAGPLISRFTSLPPGITVDRDYVWVDLHAMLRAQGFGEVVPLLTGVRVLTAERGFLVQFEIRR